MRPETVTCRGEAALAETAASRIAGFIRDDLSARGRATLVLSGGKTPEATYGRLAEIDGMPWHRVFVFWGDERMVEHGHPERNSTMAHRALLDRIDIPESNLFAVPDDCETAAECAGRYEDTIRVFFGKTAGYPVFDTVLLGLGNDGHTASLYRGGRELSNPGTSWVIGVTAPKKYPIRERVTLTLPVINNARRAVFIVSGSDKRETLREVVSHTGSSGSSPPARLVAPRENLLFLTDMEAGGF